MALIKIPRYIEGFVKNKSYTLEINDDDMLVVTESKTGASFTMDHEAAKRFVYIDGDQ